MLGLIYQTLNTFTLRTWYQSTQPIVVNPPTTTHCYLLPTTTMVDPLHLTFDLVTLTWAPTTMICGWRSHPMLVIFSWVSWHQIDAAWPQAHHGFTHPPLATHHSPHHHWIFQNRVSTMDLYGLNHSDFLQYIYFYLVSSFDKLFLSSIWAALGWFVGLELCWLMSSGGLGILTLVWIVSCLDWNHLVLFLLLDFLVGIVWYWFCDRYVAVGFAD